MKRMGWALKAKTNQFVANTMPIIREIQAAGHTSFNAIAGQLNARKVASARGGQWRHVQVRQILMGQPADAVSSAGHTAYLLVDRRVV